MNLLASQVTRLIICGDSVRENSKADEVHRGSYRTAETNKEVYADIGETYERFEHWIGSFLDKLDVDVMPGTQDFSNAYMPQ